MAHSPNLHIQAYIWEVSEDGKIAIIQHGGQHHVLMACDTFNTLHEALQRVAEIERKLEAADEPTEAATEEPPEPPDRLMHLLQTGWD